MRTKILFVTTVEMLTCISSAYQVPWLKHLSLISSFLQRCDTDACSYDCYRNVDVLVSAVDAFSGLLRDLWFYVINLRFKFISFNGFALLLIFSGKYVRQIVYLCCLIWRLFRKLYETVIDIAFDFLFYFSTVSCFCYFVLGHVVL